MVARRNVVWSVKLTRAEANAAVLAARLEQRRTGRRIYPSVLVREVGTKGVRRILRRGGKL